MSQAAEVTPADPGRRELLSRVAVAVGLGALSIRMAPAHAADAAAKLPMLQESDPAAKATQYVTDAHRAKHAQPGASCSSCALFESLSANAGSCSLFPNNRVSAGGWCSAWSSL